MLSKLKAERLFILLPILLFFLAYNSFVLAEESPKRVLSLVDYIGGDYKNAVEDGQVINDEEFAEMDEFISEAITLYKDLNKSGEGKNLIGQDLEKLAQLIKEKSNVASVEQLASTIKKELISDYNIETYPKSFPSYEKGKQIYRNNCVSCHGEKGAGDGRLARALRPPPTDFTNAETIKNFSPFKVYNTIEYGIEGTAMPAFNNLPDQEKWDAAFYVLSIGSGNNGEGNGLNFSNLPGELQDFKILATMTNEELLNKLDSISGAKELKREMLSYLRVGFLENSGIDQDYIQITALKLNQALDLYRAGHDKKAYEAALDGYLEGYEFVEKDLSIKDREFTYSIEAKLQKYRDSIKQGVPFQQLNALNNEIQEDLINAAGIIQNGKPFDKLLSFLNSFAIIVREGLEAVLIIAALIAFLTATGAGVYIRYIHIGWISALVGGLLTWILANTVISISGASRELIEGFTSLIAAAVLFYVSYWLITKIEVQKWKEYIQGKVKKALTRRSVFALAGVSFFAVYREAFETVLFYQALWYQADNAKSYIVWGFVVGFLVLLGLVVVVFKLAMKIPLKYFFSVTSLFLYFLSFILVGQGIRELQESGLIAETTVGYIPQIDVLGIYPYYETIIPQGILLSAFLFSLFWLGYVKREREKKEIAVSISQISEEMETMKEAFEHIKGHIVEWKRCENIDLEAEDLDKQIHDVIVHVDDLEDRLGDFYDNLIKNAVPENKPH